MEYLRLYIKSLDKNFTPPQFLGSMIRGAFGVSLKEVVCINPSFDCGNCFAKETCIYYEFFEAKNRFHHFRLDFALEPKNLEFGVTLFNEAVQKYPYILSALHRMLIQKGLGSKREKIEDFMIFNENQIIYDGEFEKTKLEPKKFVCDKFCPKVKIELITPLRMKREGRFLKPDSLDIKDILLSIKKKRAFYDGEDMRIEDFPKLIVKDLQMVDFSRYSNRQKTKMRIGGIVGEIVVDNLTPQTYELLKFGEIVGVGKLGTFGLGKIVIRDLK